MNTKLLNLSKKYIKMFTVVVLAFAMTTTLSFADTAEKDQGNKSEEKHERSYERMIAHGGGSVKGFETSSSVEAVRKAIENGFKVIELDMEFSSDDKIVMLHDWDRTLITYLGRKFDKRLSLNQFNNQLICGRFEPLTFDKLTKILDENPEIRIVTDTKGDNIKLMTAISEKYPDYMDKMIPQIYEYEEFETASALGYQDIIFTLYTQEEIDYPKLLKFVKENDIYAVTIPKDYWVKGITEKLAKDGVIVYTHPIYTVEEANSQLKKGVYGVYSSTLIPEELEGLQKEYYMLQTDEKGKKIKLTDVRVKEDEIRAIKVHGNMDYKAFKYLLDGKLLEDRLAELEDSVSETHALEIQIWDISGESRQEEDEPLHTMSYLLTKNEDEVRILDKKYEYRLEALKKLPEFDDVIAGIIEGSKNKEEAERLTDILSKSFIARTGRYYYFNDGKNGSYTVGDELLFPQKSLNGKVMVPLAETVFEMGAHHVTMDSSKYVYIAMNDSKIISQAYGNYIKKDFFNNKLNEPITLYRSKAMAGGEVLKVASGREFIDSEKLLIVLPEKCSVTEMEEERLVEFAEKLFEN